DREVIVLRTDVGLRHTEALRGADTFAFSASVLRPACENVRQVVLCVFICGEWRARNRAELVLGKQRRALIVEAPAVGADVVEPDEVGAAGIGFGENENRGRDAGIRLEHAARERHYSVELLVF